MSKKYSDYSNTIIYKIYCKDETIKDLYVGHTTNFIKRKDSHENACNNLNNNIKIYKTIRTNGGWENWDMVEIATYCCKDRTEARIKENEHYNKLPASLNSHQPYVNKPNYLCSICNLQFTSTMKYNYHVDYCTKYYKKYCEKNNIGENNIGKNNIGKNNIEENNIGENDIEENNIGENDIGENNINEEICDNSYNCNLCNYSTNKKFNYDKHLVTLKHKINSKEIDDKKYYCEFCNKYFNSNNSLWKHNNRKHSNKKLTKEDKEQNNELIKKQQDTIDKLVKNSVENTI
jgi:hypothetical protein